MMLLLITNRKSHMSFWLAPKSVTLNDFEWRDSPLHCFILPNSVAFGGHYIKQLKIQCHSVVDKACYSSVWMLNETEPDQGNNLLYHYPKYATVIGPKCVTWYVQIITVDWYSGAVVNSTGQHYRSILPAGLRTPSHAFAADFWSERYIRHINYKFCAA